MKAPPSGGNISISVPVQSFFLKSGFCMSNWKVIFKRINERLAKDTLHYWYVASVWSKEIYRLHKVHKVQ